MPPFMLDKSGLLVEKQPVRPIKALRLFLQKHPDTEEFSSQLGLALLTDRSESLVRAIEGGRMPMSRKFAKTLSVITGVSKDWLLLEDVDPQEVLAEQGGRLSHEQVVQRVMRQSENNLNASASYLRAAGTPVGSSGLIKGEIGDIQQQMVATMVRLVELALRESLARGDTGLMEEITRLLARPHGDTE